MFKSRPSGGMLGSVGAKIAHASTIPSLGNPDLRTLQELITAEKGVLIGAQRLAGDVAKSAEMLKNWGMGEGDDLGDVLAHSTNLLAQFSAALTQFASYQEGIRTSLKSVRTREEGLDEMKRRKRNVDGKAEAADKKLAKMGSEHKGRMAQVELLNELKQEGRQLEIDILKEEAAIGDFKRRTTREFMALKFAGLVELAEKTTIIGDLGKLMIEEIPLHTTQPGHPRAPYTGREKTSELSSEAMRCIGEITLVVPGLPDPTPAPVVNYDPYDSGYDVGSAVNNLGDSYPQDPYDGTPSHAPNSEFGEVPRTGGSGFSGGSMRIGDDGSRIGNLGAGQFNTFPSSGRGDLGQGLPTLGQPEHDREPTFSSSIADALAHDPNFTGPSEHAQPPSPPPPHHQPSVPSGTFAPPPGPPPGPAPPGPPMHQPSDSYFSRALPDPRQARQQSPLPPPPPVLTEQSPWASAPSSPSKSRPLPVVQTPLPESSAESELAYAQDEAPASPTSQGKRAYRRKNSGEFNYPYSDNASSRPLGNDTYAPAPEPELGHDQREISSAAAREVNREMDVLAMAPYASSPPRPTPAPSSAYATPSEYPSNLPNPFGQPLGTPLPRPPAMSSPAPPSLPPLSSFPSRTSPPLLSSPTATTRTIPASAFRRTVSRSDTLDVAGAGGPPAPVSPLSVRKKIPDDISRGTSPAPLSPGVLPMYAPIDPEAGVGGGREQSPSPPEWKKIT